MFELKISPFRATRRVQSQIQEFLDSVSQAGLAYHEGMTVYIKQGWRTEAESKLAQILDYEARGDALRRRIGLTLYTEMLLPDSAGDVLALLADLDHLLDMMGANFTLIGIEQPEFPAEMHEPLADFVRQVGAAIEQTVTASRVYFRDPIATPDHIHKINYFQQEAEKIGIGLLKATFATALPLEAKRHLRDHLIAVNRLANLAEETGDQLAIFAVKRSF